MLAVETLFDSLLYAASTTLTEARRLYDAGVISDDTFTVALDAYTSLRRQLPAGYVIPAECRDPVPSCLLGPGAPIERLAPTLLELFRPAAEPRDMPAQLPGNVVNLADFRKQH